MTIRQTLEPIKLQITTQLGITVCYKVDDKSQLAQIRMKFAAIQFTLNHPHIILADQSIQVELALSDLIY